MNNISFEEKVAYAKQQLQNGANPRFVFSQVWKFFDGFATVRLEDKYNFIDTGNKILRDDLWFDEARSFSEGFASVYVKNRGWTFIKPDGNFLRDDLWFDDVSDFKEGFAWVKLNGKPYYIDKIGKLYDQYKNLIENRRRTVSQRLNEVWRPNNNTFFRRVSNRPNGDYVQRLFGNTGNFYEGFAAVKRGKKENFIDTDGNILRDDLWFDSVGTFRNGWACVRLDSRWNLINTDGKLLRDDMWFDTIFGFRNGFARVAFRGKENFIKPDGNFLRDDIWFDDAYEFHNGLARVIIGNKCNFIKPDGNFLRNDIWFDYIEKRYDDLDDDYGDEIEKDFDNGFAMVMLSGNIYYIDTKGNLYNLYGRLINKANENRQRTVRLTESQLRNTIKNVVSQCLNKGRRR